MKWTRPYTYCISDVIYYLISSYGYNGRQIGQRVAQELAHSTDFSGKVLTYHLKNSTFHRI